MTNYHDPHHPPEPAHPQEPSATPPRLMQGRLPTRIKVVAVMAVAALALAGGATWAATILGTRAAAPATAQVRLEATSTPGVSPFMSPVGQDQTGVTAPAGTEGRFAGDTPGLFAEDPDRPSCDGQGLVANLQADPTKAGAWAQALGISASDIPGFVDALHPVVLRSDTAVTSYGYDSGHFSAYPAVLQAGTAVFVNSFGEPTVKCFSGNPLTRALDYPQASYVGVRWASFAPTLLTYVLPTRVVIKDYTYVDRRGGYHHRPSWCAEHPGAKCHHNPETKPETVPGTKPGPVLTPDPVLEQKATDTAAQAAQAAQIATAARAKADAAKTAAAQTDAAKAAAQADDTAKIAALGTAKQQLVDAQKAAKLASDALFKDPNNQDLRLAFLQADNLRAEKIEAVNARTIEQKASAATLKQAADNAAEKAGMFTNANAAANSAEGTQKQAEKNAAQAKAAADQAAGRKTATADTKDQKLVGNPVEKEGDKVDVTVKKDQNPPGAGEANTLNDGPLTGGKQVAGTQGPQGALPAAGAELNEGAKPAQLPGPSGDPCSAVPRPATCPKLNSDGGSGAQRGNGGATGNTGSTPSGGTNDGSSGSGTGGEGGGSGSSSGGEGGGSGSSSGGEGGGSGSSTGGDGDGGSGSSTGGDGDGGSGSGTGGEGR